MGATGWTSYEDATLRNLMAEFGYPYEKIAEHLPGRTASAVKKRAYRLGVGHKPRGSAWTPAEDAILRQFHGKMTIKSVARRVPGRSAGSVYSRMQLLGLPVAHDTSEWTEAEDALVMAARTAREASAILDRTYKACCLRRTILKKRIREDECEEEFVNPAAFTPADELELLRQEYPGETYRNYRIPSEGVSARRFSVPLDYSPTGSSAAMCAGAL